MKKKSTSESAFLSFRVVIASVLCLAGLTLALFGMGAFSSVFAQTKGSRTNRSGANQRAPGAQVPDVLQMVGPVRLNQDLRTLHYVAPKAEFEERILTRYPRGAGSGAHDVNSITGLSKVEALTKSISRPAPTMPPPLLTFDGVDVANSGGAGVPDTDGDVGPDHYVQAVNNSFKVFDKSGNALAGPTTYDSLFAQLTGTPCSGFNQGDPFAFYDQVANRWVISDFAFAFPDASFWQCVAVSQTADPVSGGWSSTRCRLIPPTQINWEITLSSRCGITRSLAAPISSR